MGTITEEQTLTNDWWSNGVQQYFFKAMGLFKQNENKKTNTVNLKVLNCVNADGTEAMVYIFVNNQLMGVNNTEVAITDTDNPQLVPGRLVISDRLNNVSSGIKSTVTNFKLGYLDDVSTTLFRVVDESGVPVNAVAYADSEDSFYIDARIKSNTTDEISVFPILAGYTSNALSNVDVLATPLKLQANNVLVINKDNGPVLTKGSATKFEAFLWDGLDSLSPFVKNITIE